MNRVCWMLPMLVAAVATFSSADNYLVGVGKADITGPPVGVPMWGFVRDGQVTEGVHIRQYSRAYVIAEPNGKRIAFVSADIGSITNFIQLDIVSRLQEKFGALYTLENVVLSATHTHAGAGGFWHYGATSPLGSSLISEHYETIIAGITASISDAHDSLAPGRILIDRGELANAGANRSMPAYENNPESERAKYAAPHDLDMTLLRFERNGSPIAELNWFAVHPTAMTYNNRLISGDHKGLASQLFEARMGGSFVAGFAQSNCGDITPNLNLNNTGPGKDEFETTYIIGDRQYQKASELFETADEDLGGPIDVRQAYVNFKWASVEAAWTGGDPGMTCPSAYGYAFAAGSTEDGGGHPMFREGMTIPNAMIDNLVKEQFKVDPPTEECKECQAEKAILFATGEMDPPGYTQILPITLARVGQLVLVCVPAEFTTMAGRRLRDTVKHVLGDDKYYVLAGYVNDYCGYVTTREEYATQQYEGGHTLYGPNTLALYQQEFDRLARAMRDGQSVEPGPTPNDLRAEVEGSSVRSGADVLPETGSIGDQIAAPDSEYAPGQQVYVSFLSGNPDNAYPAIPSYADVQRQVNGEFVKVATDAEWSTKIRWLRISPGDLPPDQTPPPAPFECQITWDVPESAAPGTYRIVHHGCVERQDGVVETFTVLSTEFEITPVSE